MSKETALNIDFLVSASPPAAAENDENDEKDEAEAERTSTQTDIRAAEAFFRHFIEETNDENSDAENSAENKSLNDDNSADLKDLKRQTKSPGALRPAKSAALKPSPGLKSTAFAAIDDVASLPDALELDLKAIADYVTFPSVLARSSTMTSLKKKTKTIHAQEVMFYNSKTKALRGPDLKSIPFPLPRDKATAPSDNVFEILEASPFWIDVCAVSRHDLEALGRLFRIHPLTLEDIEAKEPREKCELFPNYYFVSIQTAYEDEDRGGAFVPVSVYILVFKECVLTFHSEPIVHIDNVLQRSARLGVYAGSISPDWLNYALMDDIADGFLPAITYLESEVDSIDQLVLVLSRNEQTDMLRRIGNARRRATFLYKISFKSDLIKQVIKRSSERLSKESETGLYLSDIQDHIFTMVQMLDHCNETLTRAHGNYLAQISIEMAAVSNRTADLGIKVTILASILVPMNIITGLFGMNVAVPGKDVDNLNWFAGICITLVLMGVIPFILLRKHMK